MCVAMRSLGTGQRRAELACLPSLEGLPVRCALRQEVAVGAIGFRQVVQVGDETPNGELIGDTRQPGAEPLTVESHLFQLANDLAGQLEPKLLSRPFRPDKISQSRLEKQLQR